MELLEGVSLARLQQQLKDEGERLDPLLAAWIMSKVAAGLHAAHELRDRDEQPLGLVHRDVSPENVLLSYDGRVCVADFGVAKLSHGEHQTQSGIVKGKFAYMSPEQTKAKSLDRRSDVFSFGVVLHECLTGRRLFASKSAADTIRRVCEKRPADPRKRRPEVPGALAEIALRCLKKRRAQRYDDAGQLAVALRGVLRDHGSLDESDLSELLTRCFAAERSRLGTKIRRAIRVADGASDSVEAAVVEPSSATAGGSVTASVSTGPPLTARPAGVWIGLGVALLLGAGIWWTAAGPGGGATTQESTTPSASVSAPTATSTTTERTSSSTNATASVLPTIHAPSSSQPASSSAQPPPIRQPSPPPSTNAQPSALPSPGPSSVPSASATSHKGVPFKKLDL